MADRVEMKNPAFISTARPLAADVPKWEAAGWVRMGKPRKSRVKDQAEPLASPVDRADSAETTANGKGKK